MTREETRKLGIEFERRIQIMMPEKEFLDKLDTDTIYSFLNQYQYKYIHDIYRNLDKIESGTNLSAHVEAVLQCLQTPVNLNANGENVYSNDKFKDADITIRDSARSITWRLPDNYYMYIRSVSKVSSTFNFKSKQSDEDGAFNIVPNKLMSLADVWKLIETPQNGLRILRNPVVLLDVPSEIESDNSGKKASITCIYDRYTTIEGIRVIYYREPDPFNIMTSKNCELPIDCFDDLVSGAVELYIQHLTNNKPTDLTRQPVIPDIHSSRARQQAKQNNERRQRKNDES